jgi:hypothetical protein
VNPIAGAREVWKYSPAKKAEQPHDDQDYDDGPQHAISPFLLYFLYFHSITNTPRPHPSTGEYSSPPLGGDIELLRLYLL